MRRSRSEAQLTEDVEPLDFQEGATGEEEGLDTAGLDVEVTEADLLDELRQLHQQLDEGRNKTNEEEQEAVGQSFVPESNKIIVCGVRRPVKMHLSEMGEGWEYTKSWSSVVHAMEIVEKHNTVHWV